MEIGLGLVPFLQTLIGDAALVEDVPFGARRLVHARDRLVVEVGGVPVFLLPCIDPAQREIGPHVVLVFGERGLQMPFGLVETLQIGEVEAELQLGDAPHRR